MAFHRLVVCFAALLSFFLSIKNVQGKIALGVAPLNPATFDKIVPKFKAALVRFDNAYAYGDKLKEFKKLAEIGASQPELLIGEVNTRETDENKELTEKYNIQKDDFPAFRLFLQDQDDPVVYDGDKSSMDVARFIIKHTGFWLDIAPCIHELDEMVKEFWATSGVERSKILEKATNWANAPENENNKVYAEMYVKTMSKIIEKGDSFVDGELDRLEKLAGGKVSKDKKQQLQDRASILTSFKFQRKDEL